MTRLILSLVSGILLSACSNPPKRISFSKAQVAQNEESNPATGESDDEEVTDGPEEVLPEKVVKLLKLKPGQVEDDAYDFTFGSVNLAVEGSTDSKLSLERYLFMDQPQLVDEKDRLKLMTLCKDIVLEENAENSLLLQWRSYQSSEIKKLILTQLEKGMKSIRCVLKVKGEDETALKPAWLDLNLMLDEKQKVVGSKNLAGSAKETLLLLSDTVPVTPDSKNLVLVEDEPAILKKIKSLKSSDLSVKVLTLAPENPCSLDTAAKDFINPDQLRSQSIELSGVQGELKFRLSDPAVEAINGRLVEACRQITFKDLSKDAVSSTRFSSNFKCKTYEDISKQAGTDAACRWRSTATNDLDPVNTADTVIQLMKEPIKAIDFGNWDVSRSYIAKAADNPVRTNSIAIRNFDADLRTYLEEGFDIWMAIHRLSYDEKIRGYINEINLDKGREGHNTCDKAYAYANLNSRKYTYCEGAMRRGDFYRKLWGHWEVAVAGLHEAQHSHGHPHEFEDPNSTPCMGPAYSSVLDHAVVTNCSLRSCRYMKDSAVNSFIFQMNYSVGMNNRRFEGLCEKWRNEMGIGRDKF
ncbi:MAG: hypothetical protein EOP10_10850 [Proteobacteria bacterium]|nr:MAG: hypothetical protein EOP10_10850 [Pseudomonadota bacterium]